LVQLGGVAGVCMTAWTRVCGSVGLLGIDRALCTRPLLLHCVYRVVHRTSHNAIL